MKRFSAREFALLCLPVAVVAGVGFWAVRQTQKPSSAIVVQVAQVVEPRPIDVARGANVAVRVRLDKKPDDNTLINWTTDFRVSAGQQFLWKAIKGNPAYSIGVESRTFDGAWHEWNGAFNLGLVPPSYGEIVLDWSAKIEHPRRSWGRSWTEKSQRQGRIVLRRVGQKLKTPVVSRDSHLRLVESRIERVGKIEVGLSSGRPIYKVLLKFELISTAFSGNVKPVLYSIALRSSIPNKGIVARFDGVSEEFRGLDNSRQFAHCGYTFVGAPTSSNLVMEWEAQQGEYWPLTGKLPITDAKGKLLLGKKQYP